MPTTLWLVVAFASSVVLAELHSPIAPLPGVATLLLVPGAAVMSLLRTRPANTGGRVVLAVCMSMMAIMVVGGVASLIGPHVGVVRPLGVLPESVLWFIVAVLMLAVCTIKRRDPVMWIFEGVRTANLYGVLASGVLVVISILGVAQLNHTGNTHLAVASTALDVAVLIAGVVGGWKQTSRWPLNTLLYSASLALLVSTSLRGGHLYGWDIQQEFGVASHTIFAGVWVIPTNHDAYSSMLSLTVLPAVLHSVAKLRLLAFFQLVVPAILALLPLAVFSSIRAVPRWVNGGRPAPRTGLAFAIVVGLIISSVAFSSELMSITRQAMALTMLTALVMVLFDRTMPKRPAQVIIGLLVVGISFTHYTTSYLLAAILLCAWLVSLLWTRGWLGTPRGSIEKHRVDMRSRKMINFALVAVGLVAAFGWNLAVTRNSALTAPASAVTSKGAGLATSTGSVLLTPRQFELLLENQFSRSNSWIVPVSRSHSAHLVAVTVPTSPGVVAGFKGGWNELTFLAVEGLWILLGIALLYGVFRLARRRSYEYSADLVGLAVAGLAIGGLLRFSGTLAPFYSPERAAIFTAILLATPVTLFLDDLVTSLHQMKSRYAKGLIRTSLVAGIAYLLILVLGATGLGVLLFGGTVPGSLSAGGVNVEQFAISTPELATAVWLRNNVRYPGVVQSDLYGHLVLLSEPGSYNSLDEILPTEVDQGSYIYLSTVNLVDHLSQAETNNFDYFTVYRTNIEFFNNNFYVVYSTGATRVYH